MSKRTLTAAQVAEFFQVDRETVYKLAQKGSLPGFKVGCQWRFAEAAIREWYTAQTANFSCAILSESHFEEQER